MDVVILLVFISLVLVGGGLLLFVNRLREGDFDHGERLALAPLADDEIADSEIEEDSQEPPNGGTSERSHVSKGLEGGSQHVES